MIESKILWQGTLFEKDINVKIITEEKSNRAKEKKIETEILPRMWKEKVIEAKTKNQTLYDGTSYRLESFKYDNNKMNITVSPIKFSIRSSLKKLPELESLGEKYYSHGLSVGGFVVTNDGNFLFANKSDKSSSSLKIDIIGGVLEKIEPCSGIGILNANKNELKEELNIDSSMIDEIKIIGIVRSHTTDIVIVTYTILNLSSEEVQNNFEKRNDKELDSIEYVNELEVGEFLERLGGYKWVLKELL